MRKYHFSDLTYKLRRQLNNLYNCKPALYVQWPLAAPHEEDFYTTELHLI